MGRGEKVPLTTDGVVPAGKGDPATGVRTPVVVLTAYAEILFEL
jgi:hypothetical protein